MSHNRLIPNIIAATGRGLEWLWGQLFLQTASTLDLLPIPIAFLNIYDLQHAELHELKSLHNIQRSFNNV